VTLRSRFTVSALWQQDLVGAEESVDSVAARGGFLGDDTTTFIEIFYKCLSCRPCRASI
jgi:hypothetical protein